MGSRQHIDFAKGMQKVKTTVDFASVFLVCLFPLLSGAVFVRLLCMSGVPIWFHIIQGIVFAVSLAQAVYFFAFGLFKALRRKGR